MVVQRLSAAVTPSGLKMQTDCYMSWPLNGITALDAAMRLLLRIVRTGRRASEFWRYRDMKLHSTLFGWSNPDQALRVAAGILGKRASGGRWPSGHYCHGVRSLPDNASNLEASIRGRVRIEDMVKSN